MKTFETILEDYVYGLHLFNLDDDIECHYLVENFKSSCVQATSYALGNMNLTSVDTSIIEASLKQTSIEVISSLLQIRKELLKNI